MMAMRQKSVLLPGVSQRNPALALKMIISFLLRLLPDIHRRLGYWKKLASEIPDPELRRQALLSIENKAFHCEGAGIYAFSTLSRRSDILNFIVAYQTISDYLDNLCDRSTSQNSEDFYLLHKAIKHALMPEQSPIDYYGLHEEKDDGGYLGHLVQACQQSILRLPVYHHPDVMRELHQLADYYIDLQVKKHENPDDRLSDLIAWFHAKSSGANNLQWYEFAAASGSTLGIFSLIAHVCSPNFTPSSFKRIKEAYFPWVQGFHILLDYLIDQDEDLQFGDLNFCSFYPSQEALQERLIYFNRQAKKRVLELPDSCFHYMVLQGLCGIYLTDSKVKRRPQIKMIAKAIIHEGGLYTQLLCILFRILRKCNKFG